MKKVAFPINVSCFLSHKDGWQMDVWMCLGQNFKLVRYYLMFLMAPDSFFQGNCTFLSTYLGSGEFKPLMCDGFLNSKMFYEINFPRSHHMTI